MTFCTTCTYGSPRREDIVDKPHQFESAALVTVLLVHPVSVRRIFGAQVGRVEYIETGRVGRRGRRGAVGIEVVFIGGLVRLLFGPKLGAAVTAATEAGSLDFLDLFVVFRVGDVTVMIIHGYVR